MDVAGINHGGDVVNMGDILLQVVMKGLEFLQKFLAKNLIRLNGDNNIFSLAKLVAEGMVSLQNWVVFVNKALVGCVHSQPRQARCQTSDQSSHDNYG